MIKAKKKPMGREDRARACLAKMPPAIQGQGGNAQTFQAAETLCIFFDLDEQTAFRLLSEYNGRCSPPWDEKGLRQKIAVAMRYKAGNANVGAAYANDRAQRADLTHTHSKRRQPRSAPSGNPSGGPCRLMVTLPEPDRQRVTDPLIIEIMHLKREFRQAYGRAPECVYLPRGHEAIRHGIRAILSLIVKPHDHESIRVS